MHCPTCGHEVDDGKIVVDLATNQVIYDGKISVRLMPQEAEIVYALNEVFPAYLTMDDLVAKVYGSGADYADYIMSIRVAVSRIRNKLAPLDLTVTNVYGRGYRLAIANAS